MIIPVKITYQYGNKIGTVIDKYGYDEFDPFDEESVDGLFFWYEEGNGSCDCNRSTICGLEDWYDFKCGNSISFLSIDPLVVAVPGFHEYMTQELYDDAIACYSENYWLCMMDTPPYFTKIKLGQA